MSPSSNFMPNHKLVAGRPPVTPSSSSRKKSTTFLRPLPPLLGVLFIAQLAPTSPLICVALRIINLDAPRTALQGATIQLGCVYSLTATPAARFGRQLAANNSSSAPPASVVQTAHHPDLMSTNLKSIGDALKTGQNGDANDAQFRRRRRQLSTAEMLYAIKWYKDEREFYRYIAQDWPHKQTLPLDGLHVDIDKSDNQTVVLRNVSLKTSGLFRCEVSTDAPYFVTKSIERKMLVYSLPDGGPMIERAPIRRHQQQSRISIGDQLELVCRSRESKPPAQIDWIVNDSLNLSSTTPLDSLGKPIFQLANRQFVRLAAPTKSPAQSTSPAVGQNRSLIDLAQNAGPTRSSEPTAVGSHRFTTYELLHNQTDQTLTARPIDSTSSSVVDLASSSRDQLLETSLSTLNFTVDSNLLQLLNSLAKTTKSQQISSAPIRKANPQGTGPQNSKWKKSNVGGGLRATNLTTGSAHDRTGSFSLQIKCTARVMHLSMSDEVKLRLADTPGHIMREHLTRGNPSGSPEAQLQKQQKSMMDKNSGEKQHLINNMTFVEFLTGAISNFSSIVQIFEQK